jgi:hypothetical protein
MAFRISRIHRRFIPLVAVLAILVLLMPRSARLNLEYRKGSPWTGETIISEFDFPILKTQEQIFDEKEANGGKVVPYYRYSEEVTGRVSRSVHALDFGKKEAFKADVLAAVGDAYESGIRSDASPKMGRGYGEVSTEVLMVQRNKRATKFPASEVYTVSDAKEFIASRLEGVNADSLLRHAGVYQLLEPNLVFDRSMTELAYASNPDAVSPTSGMIKADQKIVSRGEIVTPEIAQLLDSYEAEYNKVNGYGGPRALLYVGDILMALLLVVVLYLSILYTNPKVLDDTPRYLYLLTVFMISAVIAFVVERLRPQLMYLIPFPVLAMYLMAFFKKRVVLPAYMVSLLPLLVFCRGGMEFFVIFLAAGLVSMLVFERFSRGWLQFVHAIIVFGVEMLVFIAFRLLEAGFSGALWINLIWLFIGSMFLVAMYPLIYLFERIFGLASTSKLVELTDTNNRLLRLLSVKAPGTFQHSLQVMNLCDAAAREIGAHVALVRAGALYHDIGKMKNPLCFIENESSNPGAVKYHDGLSAKESARDIIRHVQDGMELAKEYKLPAVIQDFILSHHGTSPTGYFLNTYLSEGGDPSDVAEFYYKGKKPQTKEQTILMICDSVEAASRTLKEFTPEALEKFVNGIVDGKIKAGQLDEANISVKDLNTIRKVLRNNLQQIYHERIVYPKAD